MSMVKTTLTIRGDIYARMKQIYGPRGVSKAINQILSERLLREESMFGTMKNQALTTSGIIEVIDEINN
jgi:predicted CopG family antitoxin